MVALAALLVVVAAACGGDGGSPTPTASSAPLEDAPAVSVHPVLRQGPCGADTAATLANRDRSTCYEVGPAFVLPGDLVNPQVVYADEAFSVAMEIADGARARAEAGFAACRAGADGCPAGEGGHGSAAIVIDRVVEAAPVIDRADIVDDGLVLQGGLTEDDAYRIVDSFSR